MKIRAFYLFGLAALVLCTAGLVFSTVAAGETSQTKSAVAWTDDFSSGILNSRWSWVREAPSYWSLVERPGFLRIRTQQTFASVNNLLVQDAPVGDYEITTRLLFTPVQNYQIAGLLIYLDDGNYMTLGRAYCDAPPPICVTNGIYFDHTGGGGNYAMTTPVQGEAYLKLVRRGMAYSGYVSTDGVAWTLVGVHTAAVTLPKIGLRVSNQIEGASEIPADFDFFAVVDDTRRMFLPLVLK